MLKLYMPYLQKHFQLCGCDSIGHFHAIYCNENDLSNQQPTY